MASNRRTAVASCNAAGKSFLSSRTAVWFLKTFKPSVVVTTAPTDRQVRRILWKEIHATYSRAKTLGNDLGGTLLTKEWKFDEEHFAMGFATRDYDATAFQGIHAPHVLVIADEAAGLTETIWEGIFSILRGAHTRLLAVGNPTVIEGTFYEAFSDPRWSTFNISAFDTPNFQGQGIVIPGLITPQDVEDAVNDWGEDSPLYKARVLGQFPDRAFDTLIPMHLVQQAGQGEWTPNPDIGDSSMIGYIPVTLEMGDTDTDQAVEIGADFARYGGDSNVFIARRGRLAFAYEEWVAQDLGITGTMAATGRLVDFIRKTNAWKVKCDAVGLGGGVPDRLREMQVEGKLDSRIQIIDMNAGAAAEDKKKYADAATEWYSKLGDKLRQDMAFGPVFQRKEVVGQLSQRKYKMLSDGRMKLESKDEMKKRGLKSPDWGDALVLAYAEKGGQTTDDITAKLLSRMAVVRR